MLRGHAGRGVWRAAVSGDRLATAGADASVKLWSLRDALRHYGRIGDDREAGGAHQQTEEDGLRTLANCPSPADGRAGDAFAGASRLQHWYCQKPKPCCMWLACETCPQPNRALTLEKLLHGKQC